MYYLLPTYSHFSLLNILVDILELFCESLFDGFAGRSFLHFL